MKNVVTILGTILLLLSSKADGQVMPYSVKEKRNHIEKLYRYKDTLNMCDGCMIYTRVKCNKDKASKGLSGGGGDNDGGDEIDDQIIQFGFKEDSSDAPAWSRGESSTSTFSTEELVTSSNSLPPRRSKITYTNDGELEKEIPQKREKPVLQSPPPEELDCAQTMRLTKFFTDTSLKNFVLSGLEVRTGARYDTVIISDTVKGSTVRMNVTSVPRQYTGPGKKANNGARPTEFTEELFASGVKTISMQLYMIVVSKSGTYDLCMVKEVIQKKLWSSIKRAPNGDGSN